MKLNILILMSIVFSQSVTMASESFHMVVIGDSIAWGAGLEENQKYYSLVRDWIAEEKNIPRESIEMQVLAHTGAMLYTENSDPIRPADLSSGNPTIAQQADMISNPTYVDLILVSGGINDVGVDNIIKLDHLENPINILNNFKSFWGKGTYSIKDMRKSSGNLRGQMHILLNKLLKECPKARIVVTGYYPIISDKSTGLTDAIKALDPQSQQITDYRRLDEPYQREQLRDKSNAFYDESTTNLNAAVNDAVSDSGDNHVAFAQIDFSPDDCYGADQSLLWKIGNDNMFDTRMSLLNGLVVQNLDSDIYRRNKFVAVGHPNEAGAIKYKDMIIKTISDIWPNWLDNLDVTETPVAKTPGAKSMQPTETPVNNDAVAWDNKGVALYSQGKYDEALECFDEATRIDPKYAKAWDNKATVLLALDRCDEFKAADDMAASLCLIHFRDPLTYIKCG